MDSQPNIRNKISRGKLTDFSHEVRVYRASALHESADEETQHGECFGPTRNDFSRHHTNPVKAAWRRATAKGPRRASLAPLAPVPALAARAALGALAGQAEWFLRQPI